jgi:hypothetical protein
VPRSGTLYRACLTAHIYIAIQLIDYNFFCPCETKFFDGFFSDHPKYNNL